MAKSKEKATSITKAVFPAAGLGTRFLPATKAQPKEMLPIVDKPTIQYVVEEAAASGIRDIILVTGRNKNAIEDHFDLSPELEYFLRSKGQNGLLDLVRSIPEMVSICYLRQKEPLGLGHAILVAESMVGKEPFAVLLGDDIIDSEIPCLRQMMDIYEKYRASVIAVHRVPQDKISNYGVVAPRLLGDRVYQVLDLVEKPPARQAPSNLAIIGRYILTPEIFRELKKTAPDAKGEIQLTNGLRSLLKTQPIYCYEFEGRRYDAGDKLGYLKATVELALKRPDLAEEFRRYLKELSSNGFDVGALHKAPPLKLAKKEKK